jgi:hypothetical protein
LVITDGTQDKTFSRISTDHKNLRGAFNLKYEQSAESLKEHIMQMESTGSEASVVIYGATLSTFCTVQGLLSMGVKSHQMVLVFADTNSLHECFKDEVVTNRVSLILIHIHCM